ncbi:hypothetical protein [Hyphomicrobium sp.]|uniref:hypothetical protein n=1 Tax=Hyphomicrobium sp. TaxID=82 RepID=UPI001E15E7F4|nr:hypothetical protein [Hyphomicrobium sp.]MBY0560062.1 hypothetical protein [Hyphomicrobium sp.]
MSTPKKLKPLLALSKVPNLHTEVTWPKMMSTKLDGFRCLIVEGEPRSRKLLEIPNLHVRRHLTSLPHGLDGELTVGAPNDPNVFTNTAKGVGKQSGEPDFTFWVFDDFSLDAPFMTRHENARTVVESLNLPYVKLLPHVHVKSADESDDMSRWWFDQGYEGAILRSIAGQYKYGRSTLNEQIMLKIKFWEDTEGEILAVHEQESNTNEAQVDELGHTKRSTAKAGKVANGTLGAVDVRWNNGKETVEFSLAAGVAALWAIKDELPGQMVSFKFNGIGVNGRPRFPIWKGLRSAIDCTTADAAVNGDADRACSRFRVSGCAATDW